MNSRVLVAGETDETDLARLARFERGLDSAFYEDPIGIIVVNQLVELPEVEMIRLQTAEAVFEALHGSLVIAIAVLGHQEDFVAAPIHGERFAHDLLRMAVVI